MTASFRAVNFDAAPEQTPDAKEIAFEVARRLDPVLHAPFAAAHAALHKVTMSRARRQPYYVALEREEDKVRGERPGVSMDELEALMSLWDQQSKIEDSLSPAPRLERWLEHVRTETLATTATREVVFAWQRLTRGWDDRSLWSLDWYLCRTLGAQLTELANTTHGWPGNEEFPEFTDWTNALRHHGAVLTAAADYDILDDEQDEEALRANAQESLRWVAEHLHDLWD